MSGLVRHFLQSFTDLKITHGHSGTAVGVAVQS